MCCWIPALPRWENFLTEVRPQQEKAEIYMNGACLTSYVTGAGYDVGVLPLCKHDVCHVFASTAHLLTQLT